MKQLIFLFYHILFYLFRKELKAAKGQKLLNK